MKNFFSKFLIVILILGFFLTPATPKLDTQNHFSLVKNEARAEAKWYFEYKASFGSQTSIFYQNYISNGYDDLISCQKGMEGQISSNIVRECFQSETKPEPGNQTTVTNNTGTTVSETSVDFGCSANPTTWFTYCIVKLIYELVFAFTSWLASWAARILDFFIFYSLQASSYKVQFVDSGWSLVRDLGNLFFIIALLYIAGKTVLGMNASNNKKVVTMVVVMALLINFSLFISQVVIDSSNILARVFYAAIENKDANGTNKNIAGDGGEKSISLGLVEQFNPQKLFTESGVSIKDNIGTFFTLLIVSIAMMIYMSITFLSIAFVFVSRVASLWILMIFSPLAFASLTMPGVKIPKFGWDQWQKELFEVSFLAPIFVFFLYLIISFGDILKIVVYGTSNTDLVINTLSVNNLTTYMAVLVPMMVLFVLLGKAKSIALDMSGDVGKTMTSALGGLTTFGLGLATGGVAALGRGTIGRFAKGASTGDTAASRLAAGTSTGTFDALNGRFQTNTIVGRWINQQRTAYGERLNRQGHEISHAAHARHDLDQMASTTTHGAKKKWSELTGDERLAARVTMERTNWMRQNGFGNRTWAQLTDIERTNVNNGIGVDNHGQIITNTQNQYYRANGLASNQGVADTLIRDASRKVGTLENIEQSAIGGSFDVRNLAKMVSLENDSTRNKILTGTTSLISQNMRLGLRKITGGTTGESQKNFLKDLSKTLTEAFKSVKLEVDLSNVGHEAKEDHSGGHGGGHH